MQTKRDHVQAYQFAMARLGSALVSGDPGRGHGPTRRPLLGTFFGVLVVVLLCIAFAVYGLLVPGGNTSWRKANTIIVEKETGNRYLYLGNELRPARNYASALLLTGNGAKVTSVSRNSMAGVRHGTPVGIPDAPDALPPAKELLSGPWTRCLRDDARSGKAGEVLNFAPADRPRDFPDDRQVLLSSADGDMYLLWRGAKYPVPRKTALIALGFDSQQPVPAPDNWLSALPTGAELTAARIPRAGEAGRDVADRPAVVGELFRTTVADTHHYYVMRPDGVEKVSSTQAALLTGRAGAAEARPVRPADIAAVPVSKEDPLTALPDVLGVLPLHLAEESLCLHQTSRGTTLRNRVVLEKAGGAPVKIPAGRGVLAVDQAQLATDSTSPQLYLITEQGVRYPLASSQSAGRLGYGDATPLPLPEDVVVLLPRGPWLSEAEAAATVVGR